MLSNWVYYLFKRDYRPRYSSVRIKHMYLIYSSTWLIYNHFWSGSRKKNIFTTFNEFTWKLWNHFLNGSLCWHLSSKNFGVNEVYSIRILKRIKKIIRNYKRKDFGSRVEKTLKLRMYWIWKNLWKSHFKLESIRNTETICFEHKLIMCVLYSTRREIIKIINGKIDTKITPFLLNILYCYFSHSEMTFLFNFDFITVDAV